MLKRKSEIEAVQSILCRSISNMDGLPVVTKKQFTEPVKLDSGFSAEDEKQWSRIMAAIDSGNANYFQKKVELEPEPQMQPESDFKSA